MIPTLQRIRGVLLWRQGNGVEVEVGDMANDHILNCIAMCQRRKELLERVRPRCKAIQRDVADLQDTIKLFVDELEYRDKSGIQIDTTRPRKTIFEEDAYRAIPLQH